MLAVGFDGSPASKNALAYATGLARREHADLLVIFVQPYTATVTAAGAYAPDATVGEEELRCEIDRELCGCPVTWTCVLARGDEVGELERLAAEHQADAIVVGRSRRRLRVLGPSVSGRLVRRARRPVIVVP